MQNGDFRYFAQKIDKSSKNLKMLNDRNDLLFKPVLMMCVSALYLLPVKIMFFWWE